VFRKDIIEVVAGDTVASTCRVRERRRRDAGGEEEGHVIRSRLVCSPHPHPHLKVEHERPHELAAADT
jgi:hypothetical protein